MRAVQPPQNIQKDTAQQVNHISATVVPSNDIGTLKLHVADMRLTGRCRMALADFVRWGLTNCIIDGFLLAVFMWCPAGRNPNISIRLGTLVAMALPAPPTTSLKRPIYLYLPSQLKKPIKSLNICI